MNDSLPPLSPDLEALLAAERAVPAPPPGAAERVFARVERTVAGPAGGGGGATAGAGKAQGLGRLALWGAVATVVAGSVAVYLGTRPAEPKAPVGVVAAPVAGAPEAPAPTRPPVVEGDGAVLAVAAATHEPEKNPAGVCCGAETAVKPRVGESGSEGGSGSVGGSEGVGGSGSEGVGGSEGGSVGDPEAPKGPAARPTRDLAAERKILEEARAALGGGDTGGASAALARHAREYPRGTLAEERDVLVIHTLLRAGDRDGATTRLTTFRRRHPASIHLPALEALLAPGS